MDPEEFDDIASDLVSRVQGGAFPYLLEHASVHMDKDETPGDEGEFAFGLDLILDSLERIRDTA